MLEEIYYGKISAEKSDALQIRHLPFSGAKNFRDLGGYQTVEGKTVRWRPVFRKK